MKNIKDKNLGMVLEELREFLHNSTITKPKILLKREVGDWDKLWSAFDNIQDSQKAIEQFPAVNADYLGVYGLLQAMVVQQDSIQKLIHVLGQTQIQWTNYPELQDIRNVRISTIGHPTDIKKHKNAKFEDGDISYSSMAIGVMQSEILEYLQWSKSGSKSKKIDLRFAINKQEEILSTLVSKIYADIKEKETEHIKRFENDSLEDSLSSCSYSISKLWSFEKDRSYSKSAFRMLRVTYDNFKNKIIQRYGYDSFEFQPGLKMEIEKIGKLLSRIENMVSMNQGVDELDLDVYVESLQNSFNQLKIMSREIDEKFSLNPKE
jgi:hypothetical protein